ncbi:MULTISPECIES: hypothetical protein [Nostocales]|uniref:Uncharacterized protein n=3 Tax=Nostocales TaxID=1161 RepID=A0A0C1NGH5_9CYAN|nr:hypothetical protein [Tolypothrix bouteillei]KAF3884127.1 hypothetical protein DA73_0400000400 [Tolypothrix bouteillei VB521301]
MVVKKSVPFFLTLFGVLLYPAITHADPQQDKQIANFIAQGTGNQQQRRTNSQNLSPCPKQRPETNTLIYFITNDKSVRVFSNNRQTLMNVALGSRPLIENAAVRIDNENPRIYSATGRERTTRYYAVYFTQNSQTDALLITRLPDDKLLVEKASCIPYVR